MARVKRILYLIKTNYFYCGILIDNECRVVKAAPIVKYMIGWGINKVHDYCRKRNFIIEKVV